MNKIRDLKIKDMLLGIPVFLVSLLLVEIVFFYSFISQGLFKHYGYSLGALSSAAQPAILMFLFVVTALALMLVLHGFLSKRLWARKFTMVFLVWASIWPVWGLIAGSLALLNIVLLVVYIVMIGYLMTQYVKDYFRLPFVFRGYTLFKCFVQLKSGKPTVIHFFSKKKPKSGVLAYMPAGFEVMVNSKSGMPYLRKIGPRAFKHGKYTLYMRVVNLKSGVQLPIYFFSKKKPKSGKPVNQLPSNFIVKENKRSRMPYLRKKDIRQ